MSGTIASSEGRLCRRAGWMALCCLLSLLAFGCVDNIAWTQPPGEAELRAAFALLALNLARQRPPARPVKVKVEIHNGLGNRMIPERGGNSVRLNGERLKSFVFASLEMLRSPEAFAKGFETMREEHPQSWKLYEERKDSIGEEQLLEPWDWVLTESESDCDVLLKVNCRYETDKLAPDSHQRNIFLEVEMIWMENGKTEPLASVRLPLPWKRSWFF
ncbi:MAG: hypothetical protein IKS83_06705 [Victivallales bacterium]|nr:hypothetical protein [Victivallales bacterium]